jgi:hypothetical protein
VSQDGGKIQCDIGVADPPEAPEYPDYTVLGLYDNLHILIKKI